MKTKYFTTKIEAEEYAKKKNTPYSKYLFRVEPSYGRGYAVVAPLKLKYIRS